VLGLAALVFLVGRIRYRAKKKRFQRLAQLWERSWVCMRCGSTWASG
jgi:hypothetical protein